MNKLNFLANILIIFLVICLKSLAEDSKLQKDFVVVGSDNAEVKIKIYSSFTCPHCANFHNNVIPKIKKEYVNTGKVQLIFIDFPLDQIAFNVSKLLHCSDKNKRMVFLDTIYERQDEWSTGTDLNQINNNLRKIVKNLGIDSTEFDKCLINEQISDKILNERINASQKYSINSTPTIIINEKKLEGSVSFKNIKKKIEKII